jgi:stress response protein YsnF
LKDQVENEIKFEKENSPDNTELLETIAKENWTLNSNGMFHELSKKVGDKNVSITFLSRSPAATP